MDHHHDGLVPIQALRARRRVSERALAGTASISRGALRAVESGTENIRLGTLIAAAGALGVRVQLLGFAEEGAPECSTIAASLMVCSDGFNSWKQHFMNLVDEFRRTVDPRLVLLPPAPHLDRRLGALLASIVCGLCLEIAIDAPEWARRPYFLPEPWFVSESEALKASALLESPIPFRRNNIFVLENFLERA